MPRRASEKLIQSKIDLLSRSKEQRERFVMLSDGKTSKFWLEIQKRIDGKAKSVEELLDSWVDMPERALYSALEQRKMYRFFKDMVEESDKAIEMLDQRIGLLEQEIKDTKAGAIV